ncbi:PREDICTED: uncharacterized protein LOC109467837 isoform X1 [Branchiostoma belcheri]|uniref:Uncharacterized protein LOC109467837 isoform X1 n=1 Tax=Branchiostoma belcheri TaxID=7741 RepID=A0A6P4YS66_BRABE|nr:PREDICTED: uncharacterized protein LOC109467837 isoform X1 [Branchiostoma belcheri]
MERGSRHRYWRHWSVQWQKPYKQRLDGGVLTAQYLRDHCVSGLLGRGGLWDICGWNILQLLLVGIYSYTATSRCSAMQALHGVNILLGFTEMVLGFVTSILCCVGMCSSNDVQPGTVIYHHAAPMQAPGGVVIMHNTTGGYPMHTAGVTYVGGGPQPVVMQPVHPVAPPAYTYASGPINPAVVVNTQSTI